MTDKALMIWLAIASALPVAVVVVLVCRRKSGSITEFFTRNGKK